MYRYSPIALRNSWDLTYPSSVRVSSSTTIGNPLTLEASTYLSTLLRESIEENMAILLTDIR